MHSIFNNTKIVFFDRGNVTHNCNNGPDYETKEHIRLNCVKEIFEDKFKIEIPLNLLYEDFSNPWHTTFEIRKQRGFEVDVNEFILKFLNKVNLECSQDNINLFLESYFKKHLEWDTPNDGLIDLFTKLKKNNINISIISNSILPDNCYINLYKHNKLDNFINNYTFSYSLNCRKPSHEIFKIAMNKENIAPNNCIMIGDLLNVDIKPANELGLKTVWYNYKNSINDTNIKPDIEISNFSQLL